MKQEKTISVWAKALFLAIEGKTLPEQKKIIRRLNAFLNRSKKAWLLGEILKKAEKIHKNKKTVKLILAREHGAAVKRIKKSITETLGKNKKITVEVKPELIAGFRVKTQNILIKASVKDFLEEFRNYYYDGQY